MLLNDIKRDINAICKWKGISRAEAASRIGVRRQYIYRFQKGEITLVNETYMRLMEELGYDIEIVYKPRMK